MPIKKVDRPCQIIFWCSREERKKLETLKDIREKSMSAVLRDLINEARGREVLDVPSDVETAQ